VAIIKEKIVNKFPDSKFVRHLIFEVESDEKVREIFTFCQQSLKKIEIFYENDYQMVFYPSHPVFNFLSDETRDKIMFNIPRDT
jgi:inositol 1,4,5-triphosphate receptor type 1/inositol 1,4,5-triphosphate receptor type 3